VTLAGTAFLLKFIYDRGWIGPAGRVAIGMGIGVALLFLGEVKLRRLRESASKAESTAKGGSWIRRGTTSVPVWCIATLRAGCRWIFRLPRDAAISGSGLKTATAPP
jgi:hypothetical protein